MSTVLIVPGWSNSGPEHWQTLWQHEHTDWQRVEQSDWDHPLVDDWLAALDAAVRGADQPILVGHSLGALLIAKWASLGPQNKAAGALLVAPADIERADAPEELRNFAPIPLTPIAFPTIVVASRTDPYLAFDRAGSFANAWGSRFHDAGDAGHINVAAGYGPWPEGKRLLHSLFELVERRSGGRDTPSRI